MAFHSDSHLRLFFCFFFSPNFSLSYSQKRKKNIYFLFVRSGLNRFRSFGALPDERWLIPIKTWEIATPVIYLIYKLFNPGSEMLIAWRFSISPITNHFPETLMKIGIGSRSTTNRLLTCPFVLRDTKNRGYRPSGLFLLFVRGRNKNKNKIKDFKVFLSRFEILKRKMAVWIRSRK